MTRKFSHWLVRAVGYEAMLRADRRLLHRACSEAIEDRVLPDARLPVAITEAELLLEISAETEAAGALSRSAGELARHWAAGEDGREGNLSQRAGLYYVLDSRRKEADCGYAGAVVSGRRSVELLRRRSLERALAAGAAARALRRIGRGGEAEGLYLDSLGIAREVGDRRLQALCLHGLGAVHAERGALAEAEALLSEAEREFASAGAQGDAASTVSLLAEVAHRAGDSAAAAAHADRAVALAESVQHAGARCASLRARGLVRGDEASLSQSLSESRRTGRRLDECRALLALCEVRAGQGDDRGARAAAEEASLIARSCRAAHLLSRAVALAGSSPVSRGL